MKQLLPCLFLFCALVPQLNAQINWQSTNGPQGGAFWNIYNDDQFAFVADEYHLYRTENGLDWEQLPYANIWPIATSPSKLAAGQSYGYSTGQSTPKFIVSYDHGSSWIEGTMPPTTYRYFSSLAVCSHGIYVPDGPAGKIFRTQDDGLTWDTIPPPGMYCYDLWAFEDRLYAEWYSKFWRLAPNGTDWEVVSPVFNNGDYPFTMFAADSLLFFATENNIWASSNSGTSWTKTPIQYHNSVDDFVKIGNRVYKSAGKTGIMYTDDFGHHWLELPIPSDHNTMDLATAGNKLLCGTYNQGVLSLDVPNNQLVSTNSGLNSATVYSMDTGGGNLWAACGNGVFAYDLNQQSWQDKALLPLPSYYYNLVAVSPQGRIVASDIYSTKLFLSKDSGVSWDTINLYDPAQGFYINIKNIIWLGENLYVEDDNSSGGVWSSDLGQNWQYRNFPSHIVFFQNKFYGLIWSGGLVSSADFGASWQTESLPNFQYYVTLFATDDRLFFLSADALGNSQLHNSVDGTNWAYSGDGLPTIDIFDPFPENYLGNIWHVDSRYYLHQPSIGFFTSLDTCKTWLPVERNRFQIIQKADTTFFAGGFGGGVLKTGAPQNYGSNSAGLVFNDTNNNGVKDPNEAPLPNIKVMVKEPGAWYPYWFVHSKSDGRYLAGSTSGAEDTLKVQISSAYLENINPPLYLISGTGNGRDFGVHFKPDITDVSIFGYYAGRPRPGFNLATYLSFSNLGTLPASGQVSVKLDPLYHFENADPAPTTVIGTDSLVWDFSQIALFGYQSIRISGKVDSSAILGNVIHLSGHITPSLADFDPSNNHFTRMDTIVGSFDPNEKQVEPASGLTATEIAEGKELTYTIQFQNTGNLPAEKVRITDPLDSALNVSTLRLVASSHPISSFRLLPGNLLEVIFENIALPDSNSNEAESHGFVCFAIQRNKAFKPAYIVTNRAAIYFDYNEPVRTNTVSTPLATPLVLTIEPWKTNANTPALEISPNPTAQFCTVKTNGRLSGAGELMIFNAGNQVCYQQAITEWSNPIQLRNLNLPDGTYWVRASGKQGQMLGKLIIIQK